MSTGQFGALRSGLHTETGGLYLAGASLAWGPGVEGAMLPGVGAAAAVLGRDLFTLHRNTPTRTTRPLPRLTSTSRPPPNLTRLNCTSGVLARPPRVVG